MSKFLYPIYKLKTKSYIKWWLYHKKAGGSGVLSEILEGFSFNLENTLNRKFKLFEIEGNSVQDGSPSPDNEVPILSSGDNGSINEKIQTRNLFDKNNIIIGKRLDGSGLPIVTDNDYFTTNYFIEVKPNTIYHLTSIINQSKCICCYDKNKNFIERLIYLNTYTFTTTNDTAFIKISMKTNEIDTLQLEQGTTATPYVPHEEQDYSIFVQQPMRSIGDVRDGFVKVDGNWYERHYIGRYIFTGEENFNVKNIEDENILFQLDFSFAKNNSEVLCNNLKKINNIWANNIEGIEIADKKLRIRINKKSLTDITTKDKATASFKSYLAERYVNGNPVYVNYLLADPLDLPCTPEQVEQLENLPSTYKDFTIIQSEDETPAYLKIQYYKEG